MTATNWKDANKDRGAWVKDMIKQKGKTVGEIAQEIDLSRTQIWRWFNTPNLAFPKLKRITDILKIDLRDYFPDYDENGKLDDSHYQKKYYQAIRELADLHEQFEEYREKHK